MRHWYFRTKDIQSFFFKTFRVNNIKTKQILGITSSYVKGEVYKQFSLILSYIQTSLNYSVQDTIDNFKRKSKKRYISDKIYLKDASRLKEILDTVDPSNLSYLNDKLRKLQLQTLSLAKNITDDLKCNTDISFWMGGGTLLGAIRHKGFIPWDDDIDFDMLRNDYKKLEKYFFTKYRNINTLDWRVEDYSLKVKEILSLYPNEIIVFKLHDVLKCVKGTPSNFVSVDFFAWDYYNNEHNVVTLQSYATNICEQLTNIKMNKDLFKFYEKEIMKNKDIVEYSDVIAPGIDNHAFKVYSIKEIVRQSDIFPLQDIEFENHIFPAPFNSHIYLKSLYNFYKKIPIEGLNIGMHSNTKDLFDD